MESTVGMVKIVNCDMRVIKKVSVLNSLGIVSLGEYTLGEEVDISGFDTGDYILTYNVTDIFDKTHTLIIEHCVNDYALQIPPVEVGETLRKILTSLQKKYSSLRMVVSSPTYCYIVKDGANLYCDTTELGPYVLEEYILEEENVCAELGVTFVDNYHQDVITKETMDQYYLDGLHLNEAGRQFMADNIVAALRRDAAK